jgi:DNA-binding transcriptional MerR regulator
MRIGELSDATGVSVRSIRYYEEQGLLQPERTGNGYRTYTSCDVIRVNQIQVLFAAGLCSSKIADVLPCVINDEHDVVVPLAGTIREFELAKERIAAIIEGHAASIAALDRIIDAGRRAGVTA